MIFKLLFRGIKLYLSKKNISQEELAEDYDSIASIYDKNFRDEMIEYTDLLIDKLELSGNEKIIDAGCGTGGVTYKIKDRWSGVNIICVDISREMLKKIERRENIEVYQEDMIEFLKNINAESIDIIVAAWSLSYVPHKPFIREASRVLKRNGRIGIIVNRKDTLYETRRVIIRYLSRKTQMLKKLMRVYLPKDAMSMAKLLEKYGFKITFMKDYEKKFEFKNSREAVEFVFSTGALAGFMKSFDKKLREEIISIHPNHVIHRFCIVVGRKI